MSMNNSDVERIVKIIAAQERAPCSHPVIQANAARSIFIRFLQTYARNEDHKALLRGIYQEEAG